MNVFALPDEPPADELFERLAGNEDVLVERIVSTGQFTPPGEWLEEQRGEWIVVLQGQAELSFDDGSRERTSAEPRCIWLAVHASRLAR